jgi:hypothetical protein
MTLAEGTDTISVADGEVRAWIDGGIHLKAGTPSGDPVELSAEEARLVIDGLVRLVAALEAG